MKLLCVSDQIDPFIYSSSIKERFGDVDAVISAGDLPDEYLEFLVSALNKPVFFVFGNHNLKNFNYYHNTAGCSKYDYRFKYSYLTGGSSTGAVYIGFKCIRTEKMLIAGLSGSLKYNKGLCQYSERQMKLRLLLLIPSLILNKIKYGRFLDILVTHAAPRGIHDKEDRCHMGFKCFLSFMKIFKPRFLIHGHIHLYDLQDKRISEYEKTTVINAYSHYIIETGDFE